MVGLKGEAQLPVVLKSGACESLLFVIPLSTVSYCAWSAVSTRQAPVAASSVAPAFLWRPRGRSQLNGRDVGQASRDAVGQATRTGCRMSMMSEPARKPPPGFDDLPVDQQIDGYFHGDEAIVLRNLYPGKPRFTTFLPGTKVRCFVDRLRDLWGIRRQRGATRAGSAVHTARDAREPPFTYIRPWNR